MIESSIDMISKLWPCTSEPLIHLIKSEHFFIWLGKLFSRVFSLSCILSFIWDSMQTRWVGHWLYYRLLKEWGDLIGWLFLAWYHWNPTQMKGMIVYVSRADIKIEWRGNTHVMKMLSLIPQSDLCAKIIVAVFTSPKDNCCSTKIVFVEWVFKAPFHKVTYDSHCAKLGDLSAPMIISHG